MRTEPVRLATIRFPSEPSRCRVTRSSAAVLALRILVLPLMMTVLAVAPSTARAGQIYNIVDYPSLEDGYTISGNITTSGETGTGISADQVWDWNVTISNSTGPVATFTPSDSLLQGTTFTATSTALSVDPAENDYLGFQLSYEINPNFVAIGWYGNQVPGGVLYAYGDFFDTYWVSTTSGPFTVATAVPEPSTSLLLVSGAVAFILYGLSSQRREKTDWCPVSAGD